MEILGTIAIVIFWIILTAVALGVVVKWLED